MVNILMILIFIFNLQGCLAPRPPSIYFSRNLRPINFGTETNNQDTLIKSQEMKDYQNKQFIYSTNDQDHYNDTEFINYIFENRKSDLESYGVTAQIELFIKYIEDNQEYQIILECIRY